MTKDSCVCSVVSVRHGGRDNVPRGCSSVFGSCCCATRNECYVALQLNIDSEQMEWAISNPGLGWIDGLTGEGAGMDQGEG